MMEYASSTFAVNSTTTERLLLGTLEESLESHVKHLVLKKLIGRGCYGNVYQSIWNGHKVAAKRLHSFFFQGSSSIQYQYRKTIQQECNFLKKLDHPNVMKLHTVLFPKGLSPIIITELLHCDLRSYIRESTTSPKIPEMKLICIALDVIEGLNYMHGLDPPVVHGDLATSNILLTVNGNAKIGDLGLATFKVSLDTAVEAFHKTPLVTYPARRMTGMQRVKCGSMGDIYSFGEVVVEMITGHLPRVLYIRGR